MGEVYKAKDTRLDRTVAIKTLSSSLSSHGALRRFAREARTISRLNHPHICALHDIGHEEGLDYLVMEYLDGEVLASGLQHGPLPPSDVLRYSTELADALGAAHRQGIIHRDVKPGNVILTKSGAKLLDFGIATLNVWSATFSEASTLSLRPGNLTGEEAILGTLQYMAPEQLEGRSVDSRADIFSLGAVIYEMATGKRAFEGRSPANLIEAILRSEPSPVSQVQPKAPPALDHVVAKCMAKDPDQRWQDAHDVALELKWIAEDASPSAGARASAGPGYAGKRRWLALAALALFAAIVVGMLATRRSERDEPLVRFIIPPPEHSSFQGTIAVSPDGEKIAYVTADAAGQTLLWLRQLDSPGSRMLPAASGAMYPFWSPDSRFIAYFARGKLSTIGAAGDTSRVVCEVPDGRGGSWSRAGVIVYSAGGLGGLYRVPAEGGVGTPATTFDSTRGVGSHRFPTFLPDGRHFLYVRSDDPQESRGVYVGSLDSKASKLLLPVVSRAAYAKPGYLLYLDQGNLVARRFDARRLMFSGEARSIGARPWIDDSVYASSGFSVSESGVLAYRGGGTQRSIFTWFDREGNRLRTVGPLIGAAEPAFSPDQGRIVFHHLDNAQWSSDEWLLDLATGKLSRFTFHPSDDSTALWSPDGARIVWSSNRTGHYELFHKPATGEGDDEPLLITKTTKFPDDWSRDGSLLLYDDLMNPTGSDLWVLPVKGDRRPYQLLRTAANESHGRFSPDGRWIAYASDESGETEIYVQPLAAAISGKWQVSAAGGYQPSWRRDGQELFYVAADGMLMAVDVKVSGTAFVSGTPRSLFKTPTLPSITGTRNDYLVSADGQQFLLNVPLEVTASLPITVVLNWAKLLKDAG